MRNFFIVISTLTVLDFSTLAYPAVTRYTNKASWFATTPDATTISFQEYVKHTVITDQYSQFGVIFSDGNDAIRMSPSLLNDGVGLSSNDSVYGVITMEFAQPRTAIAADYLGDIDILLYLDGDQIYTSNPYSTVQSRFGGLISTIPFDSAVIRDPSDGVVVIDDLFFGPPVPGPGAITLLSLALLASRRRRR